MLHSLIFAVGILSLLTTTYRFARLVHIYFLRTSSLPRYRHGTGASDPWALISGSTDGIGFGLAEELCSRGFNVIIHGRSASKLARKAAELRAAFPSRSIKTWLADALDCRIAATDSGSGSPALQQLLALVRDENLNLTIVINNIGGADAVINGAYRTFAESTPDDINGMVQFNAGFALHLTRTMMPTLLANKPSLIMTIGSHADAGSPYVATYGASKAFDMAFSTSLKAEMQGEGLADQVEVIGVVSGQTVSGTTRKEVSFTVPSARAFAVAALDKVGCGRNVISAYWVHGFLRGVLNFLPESRTRALLVKTILAMREERRSGAWDAKSK